MSTPIYDSFVPASNSFPVTEAKYVDGTVITPEMYGAKGDGITDDTAAINQCLSDNPSKTIVFSEKTYCISNTLHAYGANGGQCVKVGGAKVEWVGATDETKCMYRMDLSSGATNGSKPTLEGGTWACANKTGYGIIIDGQHAVVSNCRVVDATVASITIGKETITPETYVSGTARSLQATVNDCMAYTSEANGAEHSDKAFRIGLLITESDNVINGFISNRLHKGIELRAAGNVFNNVHVCATYKTKLEKPAACYAIYVNPLKTGSINGDFFNNCYFDNYTYIVGGSQQGIVRQISISNSYYFYSGNQTTGSKVEVYVTDGNVLYVHINGLTSSKDSSCNLMDLYPCISANHYHALMSISQDIYKSRELASDSAYQVVCSDNYFKNGEYASIINTGFSSKQHVYHVGSIVTPNYENERFAGVVKFCYSDRTYTHVEYTLAHQSTGTGWEIKETESVINYLNVGDFYIESSPTVIEMDNGQKYKEYKILFKRNDSDFSHGDGVAKISHQPYSAVYWSHRKAFDVTSKNYDLDNDYIKLPMKVINGD